MLPLIVLLGTLQSQIVQTRVDSLPPALNIGTSDFDRPMLATDMTALFDDAVAAGRASAVPDGRAERIEHAVADLARPSDDIAVGQASGPDGDGAANGLLREQSPAPSDEWMPQDARASAP